MRLMILTMIAAAFLACGNEIDCEDPNVVCEDAGAAQYFLSNLSTYDLTVQYQTVPQLGSVTQTRSVTSGSTTMIAEDAIIGVNPLPSDTFASFSLSATASGGGELVLVYRQDPIDNERWSGGLTDSDSYGLSEYTLTVTDQDLSF